jgi:hypothetical protein
LTRDYSEVQKGKDICDRVCGVAKARMRSWIATGNDLLNAIDIKEGMEYAGGITNTKIAVVEIVPDQGERLFIEDKFYILLMFSRSFRQNKHTKCINTSFYTLHSRPYESV